jgi:hypothetical protein
MKKYKYRTLSISLWILLIILISTIIPFIVYYIVTGDNTDDIIDKAREFHEKGKIK